MTRIGPGHTDDFFDEYPLEDGMVVSISIIDGDIRIENIGDSMNVGQLLMLLSSALVAARSTIEDTGSANDSVKH